MEHESGRGSLGPRKNNGLASVSIVHDWILLIHQLPGQPSRARVRIWRRLQRLGAVALKNAAYVLPWTETTREDFGWVRQEIVDVGGEANLFVARTLDAGTDREIVELFRAARDKDYEALIAEGEALLATLEDDERKGHLAPERLSKHAAVARQLRSQWEDVSSLDFFDAGKAPRAGALMAKLDERVQQHQAQHSEDDSEAAPTPMKRADLLGKTWVTRKRLHIDRLACAWLIVRFLDPKARFRYVADERKCRCRKQEICFDMYGAELSHHGDDCSFETFLKRAPLKEDAALAEIAQIVHDIDLKDDKFGRDEAAGVDALVRGLARRHRSDEAVRKAGLELFDALYAQFQKTP